ncbi:energy transducer TonB [Sphingomonas sp. RS6]
MKQLIVLFSSIVLISPAQAQAQGWPEKTSPWAAWPGGGIARGPLGCTTVLGSDEHAGKRLEVALAVTVFNQTWIQFSGSALAEGEGKPSMGTWLRPFKADGELVDRLNPIAFHVRVDATRKATRRLYDRDLDRIYAGSGFIVDTRSENGQFKIAPKNSGEQLRLLRRCATELARRNPGSGKPMATKPRLLTPQAQLFTIDDYPDSALRMEQEGRVQVELQVSAQGLVSGCEVAPTSTAVHQSLRLATCDILSRRAKFAPALDAAGQATEGNYPFAMSWALPSD